MPNLTIPNPSRPQQGKPTQQGAASERTKSHPRRISTRWKIAGALALLGLFLAVLLLVPALRAPPVPDESMRWPSMTNVPPPGSLSVEVEPEVQPNRAPQRTEEPPPTEEPQD